MIGRVCMTKATAGLVLDEKRLKELMAGGGLQVRGGLRTKRRKGCGVPWWTAAGGLGLRFSCWPCCAPCQRRALR
jgi:hypothetical protein